MKSSWKIWRDRRGRVSALRIGVLALLLMPLAKVLIEAQAIAHAARPINELSIARHGKLVDVRRMLGVGTFCYIAAHLTLFNADQMFDLGKVAHEITHRWYLIVGGTAWLGLALLAATSTDGMTRRLGPLRWRRLHQSIYGIALLALIHYFQQTKADVTVPTFAASLFFWLMAYRLLAWWRGSGELSTVALLALSLAVSALTFVGEAAGIGIAYRVSPMRVLEAAFDFDLAIRPGWQVLGAGLIVVAVDFIRTRASAVAPRLRTAIVD
jgi:sulfoxide reductase heme-binding subunit YedZ